MAQLDPAVAAPRPAERRLFQPLGVKAKASPVPPDDLDPVCPLGAEHVKRAVERIGSGIAHQTDKPVRPFPEVPRPVRARGRAARGERPGLRPTGPLPPRPMAGRLRVLSPKWRPHAPPG